MSTEQEKTGERLPVFLSYTPADQEKAEKVREYLSRYLNARVFAEDSLSLSENWKERLRDEISGSKIFICIVSSHWFDSSWMRQELGTAWALDKPVLSVSTDPDFSAKLPVELEKVRYVTIKDLNNPIELTQAVQALLGTEGSTTGEEVGPGAGDKTAG